MERNRMKTQHLAYQYVETASESAATSSEVNSDDVTTTCDAVMITDSKEAFRRFGGPTVKAISLPHDVLSTSDRHLIELENQVQRMMEAHLAPKPSVKQAFGDTYNPSWKIHPNLRWRQPQNSQNNFSNPPNRFQSNGSFLNRAFNNNPQNFNNQSNLKGLVSNFMVSQDARLSKFEADFKQQQTEMTNKIDTLLKAINERMTGALLSDTVKNLKLNVSPTFLVLSARSYPLKDPQSSSHPFNLVNAIKRNCEKRRGIRMDVKTEDFYIIDMEKDPTCPLLVGRGFLATVSAVIDFLLSITSRFRLVVILLNFSFTIVVLDLFNTTYALQAKVRSVQKDQTMSMRMEQYRTYTGYALWEVIMNGDAPAITSASAGTEGLVPPKIAEQKLARKNE
ncbi:hypothetical protein Tco_0503718 [Tanacetum coccineum]